MDSTEAQDNGSTGLMATGQPLDIWTGQNGDLSQGALAKAFLTDEQLDIISWVVISFLLLANIAGLVCNSLSLAVFLKLGFAECSNMSLTALTIL
ncbi:hypothetical protein PoB_007235800 [Plakobranchus ocellatus]|uniref:G-protein coupled receptors family 1 profile domain-containing protein n=1 Tax=Plakobranchus ocellatus TaxID=259542 RepID=A0AAV4DNH0_9GAST|nr:hypothetical protein PoB_007235800 [Plakobranchus ocellatus]